MLQSRLEGKYLLQGIQVAYSGVDYLSHLDGSYDQYDLYGPVLGTNGFWTNNCRRIQPLVSVGTFQIYGWHLVRRLPHVIYCRTPGKFRSQLSLPGSTRVDERSITAIINTVTTLIQT